MTGRRSSLVAAVALLSSLAVADAPAQDAAKFPDMSFFITSTGSGKGADLGGLAGADRQCQALASAVGAGAKTWRAYLSTQAVDGQPAVNARDRIGRGPWQNATGVTIARNLDDLHNGNNNVSRHTALTERGEMVNGRGDRPNTHDIITGTRWDGTAFPPGQDMTCGNWTRGGSEGAVMVGHHDRVGLSDTIDAKSWNASHPSRGGCSMDALRSSGGAGLFYCFAAD